MSRKSKFNNKGEIPKANEFEEKAEEEEFVKIISNYQKIIKILLIFPMTKMKSKIKYLI